MPQFAVSRSIHEKSNDPLLRVIAVALLMSATFAAAVPVDPCQCEYADKASLGKGAEAIVSDFISQAKRAGLREKTGLTTKGRQHAAA